MSPTTLATSSLGANSSTAPAQKPFSLRRQAGGSVIVRIFGGVALLALHSLLGRRLGTSGYGTISFALAVATLVAPVVSLGWPMALTRWIVEYVADNAWGCLRGALVRSYQVTLVSSLAGALLLFGVSRLPAIPPANVRPLGFAALILPCLAVSFASRRAYQGFGYVRTSLMADEVALPALACVAFLLFGVHNVVESMAVYAACAAIIAIGGAAILFRQAPPEMWLATPRFETRSWASVALPMALGGISQVVMNRTDTVMLGIMSSMGEVGNYSAANRLAVVSTFVLGAVNAAATPAIARAYHRRNRDQLNSIFRRVILWSSLGGLPLAIVMFLFPAPLLSVFGNGFESAAPLLRILAFGQLVNAVTGPVGIALLMMGEERQFARSLALAAIANVVGNAIAIPIAGAIGAAAVTAATVTVLNIGQWALVNTSIRRIVPVDQPQPI